MDNNKSIVVKNGQVAAMSSPKTSGSKKNIIANNPVMHLISKRLALKTNN